MSNYDKLDNNNTQVVDIAIIGSGFAGVTATLELLENNCDNILLVEALDRIGGRTYTVDHDDSFFEMGAQWIHGQVNNPIFYYAVENKLLDDGHDIIEKNENAQKNEIKSSFCTVANFKSESKTDDDENEYGSMQFYAENGDKISNELVYKACSELDRIIKNGEKFAHLKHDSSFGDYVWQMFNETVLNSKEFINSTDQIKSYLKGIYLWRCNYECGENACSNLNELSLKYFGQFIELDGSQLVELKYGYKGVMNSLINKNKLIKDKFYSKLRLKHVLKRVLVCEKHSPQHINGYSCEHCFYTNDQNKIVLLIYDCNKEENVVIICNHVICTMSLGHLKANFNSIFVNKQLFESKWQSVQKLGFGTVNKIYLIYDEPFWNEDSLGFQLIWLNHNDENLKSKFEWYRNIIGFERVKNHENILCVWLYGCEYYESLSDDVVINDCTNILRKFLMLPDIPKPSSIKRSNWYSNPFFGGSYTFIALNSTDDDIKNLAKPIPSEELPLVNFAGEATHGQFYSTVHGAYLTGKRESKRILDYISNKTN